MDINQLKANVFPGESGGDYNALFGYSNRPSGQFEGVNLTDMTVNEALQFASPSGPYAQWVKGQVGRVATPMGAYQVVGTTLRSAKEGLGLTGNERMTPELQDQIGQWIYQAQGPAAWEAWGKGGSGGNMQRPTGLLGTPTVSTQGQMPEQPQEKLPFFRRPGVGNFFDTLAMGLQGMTLNPNQALIQASQGRIQQRREAAQTEQQRNRTAAWLESQGMDDLAQGVRSGALGARDAMTMARGAEATSKQRDYQYLLQQGVPPEQAMERVFGRGGTTVNIGSEVGTIPQGYELFTDPETGARSLRPIAGGPVAAEREEALKRQKKIEGQRGTKESVVSRDVDRLIGMIDKGGIFDLPEAGIVGGALANLGINQEAVTFRNTLAGIQSQVAFDRLQQMREASKTGGALGSVSERELDLLMSALGALQQTTDPQTLKENLMFIRDTMTKIENDPVASQAYYGGTQSQSQGAAPDGGFSVTGVVD